ncbi:hypothetical protein [Klebsiella michiganensis]|uniref:hypothetical protein n=1 Tax=Klebsiella michiganensis TaxID=1134687 RepID=UPI0013D1D4AB|nr:hypothetical protein [Klebsiella michiganensis]
MTYEDDIENEMVDWQNERTFESIELTTLDHAIAAYRHYKSKNIDLTKLEQNDIFRDIYEIKSIIYSYGNDFIEEKKEKDKISPISEQNRNCFDDPHNVLYNDNMFKYVYSDTLVDYQKAIKWIKDPEELKDTLEQAALKKNGNFYISDLVDYYKDENISFNEIPKEIEEGFLKGDYDKFKTDANSNNYEELRSHYENKELLKEFSSTEQKDKRQRFERIRNEPPKIKRRL